MDQMSIPMPVVSYVAGGQRTVIQNSETSETCCTLRLLHRTSSRGSRGRIEEEEEYDTDSDAEYPIADNYEVDSLDDLLFLRAVTTRSGRMVRVVHRE